MKTAAHGSWFQCRHPRPDAKMRLICFPHGGGGPQVFQAWGQALPEFVEVVAVALPGRAGRHAEPAIDDMEQLVGALVAELPPLLDRPVAFFGHSVGALVAFVTAHELCRQGLQSPLRLLLSAYAAPEVAAHAEPMHEFSDDALMAAIGELGLLPSEVAISEELRGLILPPLRADFRLAERWRGSDAPPLACPITVLGGSDDQMVAPADLDGWQHQTQAGFSKAVFEGSHFYTETQQDALLAVIAATLRDDLTGLLPSVLAGAAECYPLERCLHELFSETAQRATDALAIVGIDQALTYGELDERSDLLARRLMAMGCCPDRLIAIFMETSVDFVIAYLAALKAGGAYLPIDPATTDAQLGDVLDEAAPVAVLTRSALRTRLPPNWQGNDRCILLEGNWVKALEREDLPRLDDATENPGPDSLAYCVMTSGTTGKPKGIICPHKGAVNSYWWRYRHLPYGNEEREACNVFFVWEVLRPLLQGRPAFVIPDDVIYDPRRLVAFLAEHRITRVLFTPSLLEQLLNATDAGLHDTLSKLRVIYLNGEVVSTNLVRRCAERLPHVRLVNDYSISECHDITTGELDDTVLTPGRRFAPAGKAMANVRIYVLDDDLLPLPWGVTGEIYIAGPTLARGYLNQPILTAERFVHDPLQPGDERMFRTGDVGRLLEDGQLEIKGRAKFMIKLRGYTIVPEAVEAAITAHPAIGAAAVVVVDDPETGQPDHLVAYIVGSSGRPDEVGIRELRQHLKSQLPHYAVPSRMVALHALPLNETTGKLDLKGLPTAPAAAPRKTVAWEAADPDPLAEMAPSVGGNLRRQVAALWLDVLGETPREGDDNFFDLGGHSLMAVELVMAVEDDLGVTLNVVDVYNHPTLAALCDVITERLGGRPLPAPADAVAAERPLPGSDIAVIGLACRFPGATDAEQLWRNIETGVESITRFSDAELRARGVPATMIADKRYIKAGAVLDDVANFEPAFWGLSEREAVLMDPQQRLFLECCWHALENAGVSPGDGDGERTGIFAGCYLPSYLVHHLGAQRHLNSSDPTTFHLAEVGNDKDYLASRVAYHLGLTGPALSIQTSCSTGLVTIAEAAAAIRAGRCETALAGAASITFPQAGYMYIDGHINSRNGHCRAFDAGADGTILGDGVGVVVLKRLEHARTDGDNILAVIKGIAVNNDGNMRAGFSAPGVRGQADVIGQALADAGVGADTISYVEAHGTGTLIGDPIEISGLTQAYRRHTDRTGYCAIGSIKPNIGHSNIAAGVAGFIKTVQALRHRRVPPLINFDAANPDLRLETSPFYITTEGREWPVADGTPRRAGVSSFGIGGTNAHVILEEAPLIKTAEARQAQARVATAVSPQILLLSAKSADALAGMRDNLGHHLEDHRDQRLADVATTLQTGRRHFGHRLAVVADDHESAVAALRRKETSPKTVAAGGQAVFLFPGQGSQYCGMGAGLYRSCLEFAQEFDRCAELFAQHIDLDLHNVFDEATGESLLGDARGLQPALFAIEYALARTLMSWGIRPAAVAGHSLGEYVAATIAEVIDLANAVELVAVRAIAMQACGDGAMVSLVADAEVARELMADIDGLSIAAINSPNDIVLSGPLPAIAALERVASQRKCTFRRLHVTRAFHSPMMGSAADTVNQIAARMTWRKPLIPLASNLTGRLLGAEDLEGGAYWSRQMLASVRFSDNLKVIWDTEPAAVIEVGPGRALGGLATKVARQADLTPTGIIGSMRHANDARAGDMATLDEALSRAWQLGVDINWAAYGAGREAWHVPLPEYPFARRRYWPVANAVPVEDTLDGAASIGEVELPSDKRFYLQSWRRSSAPAPAARQADEHGAAAAQFRWLLLLDADGVSGQLGDAVGNDLEARGYEVRRHYRRSDQGDNGWAEAAAALSDHLACTSSSGLQIGYFWSLGDVERGVGALEAVSPLAGLIHDLAQLPATQRSALWTFGAGGVSVIDEPTAPQTAALLGPILVASQECPALTARYVDLVLPVMGNQVAIPRLAEQITSELDTEVPRAEPIVALRGRHRLVEYFQPLTIDTQSDRRGRRLLEYGAHIITGGLGRIGLELARQLVQAGCDVMLTTRGEFPHPEFWPQLVSSAADDHQRRQIETLLDIAKGLGSVTVITADVADVDAMRQLLSDVQARYGTLGGIFHAAGLADLRYMADAGPDTYAAEFRSKVLGTQNLVAAIGALRSAKGSAPAFVAAFSSLAAVLGGLGMSAYAAANRSMDAIVTAQSGDDGVRWITINWDDWDFDYGKEQVGAYERTRAGFAMSPRDGLSALEAILGTQELVQVSVATTELRQRAKRWLSRQTPAEPAAPADTGAVIALPATNERTDDGLTTLHRMIQAAYIKVLGSERIGLDDNFFDLGGDSLLATQVVMELSPALPDGVPLRIADVFDHPSVGQLATMLETGATGAGADRAAQ